jgi:hypothetical protein
MVPTIVLTFIVGGFAVYKFVTLLSENLTLKEENKRLKEELSK